VSSSKGRGSKSFKKWKRAEANFGWTENSNGGMKMEKRPSFAKMHPGPGFRIKESFERIDPKLILKLVDYSTPDISDQLNRLYAVNPEIKCFTGKHHKLFGQSCTVKVFPADNLMVHKALDIAKPGDVIVVDAGASPMNAVIGDVICMKAKHRGIAGFVIDGFIRDLPAIEDLDFPVFARGTTAIGPLHTGPGEVNYPICCGGVVVNSGDVIVADGGGIVVIPSEIFSFLLERLEADKKRKKDYLDSVRKGQFSNEWVEEILRNDKCEIVK
jgi:RraA family protein